MEIWVNPACSKCASALEMLDEAGAEYTVRRYLDEPPTAAELGEVLERLGLEPWDIARVGEDASGLPPKADRQGWIAMLAEKPELIQRPIITADDGTAVIGRTPEAVRSVLE
ncbi:ArsC/Spx/MgsR family protein [Saccharopolyspora taberi]|uniref:Arsenate reductase family protein n=1 Tax=Saccharopolyspora taberi TaxID=60895 RepID=A0ABN3V633_9PSEU